MKTSHKKQKQIEHLIRWCLNSLFSYQGVVKTPSEPYLKPWMGEILQDHVTNKNASDFRGLLTIDVYQDDTRTFPRASKMVLAYIYQGFSSFRRETPTRKKIRKKIKIEKS